MATSSDDFSSGGWFDRLSDDLLMAIADLGHLKDLSKLIRTSKCLYQRLNSYLYITGMKRDGRPLQYACRHPDRGDVITRLLSYHESEKDAAILQHRFRYNYNCSASKKTPLVLAIRFCNLSAVRTLLDHGAKLDLPDDHLRKRAPFWPSQPIHLIWNVEWQCRPKVQHEMLELLLDKGADVNARMACVSPRFAYTPLYLAIMYGTMRSIRFLLARGASVTDACDISVTVNAHGHSIQGLQSPFSLFLKSWIHEDKITPDVYRTVLLFVEAGAKQKALDSMLLDCLTPHEDENWAEIVDLLLTYGANPKTTTEDGEPCLVHFLQEHLEWRPHWNFRDVYATSHENRIRYDRAGKVTIRIIKLFTQAGVNINYTNFSSPTGRTPWMVAAALRPDFEHLFRDILNMGADGRARDRHGGTAFHAMFLDSGTAVKERIGPLVTRGCPLHAKNHDGNTLLHMAALAGMTAESWLPVLAKHKFDFLAKNKAGQTFIKIICRKPATPFEPERYDIHLDMSLRDQIDDLLKKASPMPKKNPGKPKANPRNRGKGPKGPSSENKK
ncbi:ankyrin repeat-containing domain protein [Apiospora arundinis]